MRAGAPRAEEEHPRYYVNSFVNDDITRAELAAERIREPLEKVTSILSLDSFTPSRSVINSFLLEQLKDESPRPYLTLAAIFLRDRKEILERHSWSSLENEQQDFLSECAGYEGELHLQQLNELSKAIKEPSNRSVCFIGPYDFQSDRFYISNILDGDRRFAGRYFTDCGEILETLPGQGDLHVEIVAPHVNTLNLVRRFCDVGFSFGRKWSHGYKGWIEPEDVQVGIKDSSPYFFHKPSKRQLRFHFRGLLLAHFLPIEYQLLLIDHCDSFVNPFCRKRNLYSSNQELSYDPGLNFGPVSLRRESWAILSASLLKILESSDQLGATMALRLWFHNNLCGEDFWYFEILNGTQRGEKPRFLDLLSPLSVAAFTRSLRGKPCMVRLSKMQPACAGQWKVDGNAFSAELMVEVQ